MGAEPELQAASDDEAFSRVFCAVEPSLRRALTAGYGFERGREATAEALAWAWEHRDRLAGLDCPLAYLYRVGQSKLRRRRLRVPFARSEWDEPWVEPALAAGLRSLTTRQRIVVVLVVGYSWTPAEVAGLLGLEVTTVRTHLDRALHVLRSRLKVGSDG